MKRPFRNPALIVGLVGFVLLTVANPLLPAMSPGWSATKKTKTARKPAEPPAPKVTSAIAVTKLVEATRTAGLRDAYRFGVKLGTPVCPSGTKSATATVQCLVTLGTTSVAYIVTSSETGLIEAQPTFPLIATTAVETAIRRSNSGLTRIDCGKSPFLVQPVASVARCTVAGSKSGTVSVRVLNARGDLRVE